MYSNGSPAFKIRDMIKRENVRVLSSNYALYGSLSAKVSSVLLSMVPTIENYSIDESFLNLGEFREREVEPLARELLERVQRWVGYSNLRRDRSDKDTGQGRQLHREETSAVSRRLRSAFQPSAGRLALNGAGR